jgi:hypothetical protein
MMAQTTWKAYPVLILLCMIGTQGCKYDVSHTYGDFSIRDRQVYCGDQLISVAKASHFQYIDSQYINYESVSYARDATFVYTCEIHAPSFFSPAKPHATLVSVLDGANPVTFELISHGYSRDDKNVYFNDAKLKDAIASSFTVLNNDYVNFGYDTEHVYFEKALMPVVNPKKFHLLGGIFASDDLHVYAERTRITIDPFKADVLSDRLIRDANNVYYANKMIQGADACSFAPGAESADSMDKTHFYYQEGRWDLTPDRYNYELKHDAHVQWQQYYRKFREQNKSGCPRKRVLIPRHNNDGIVEIVDIPDWN